MAYVVRRNIWLVGQENGMGRNKLSALAAGVGVCLALSACGANQATAGSGSQSSDTGKSSGNGGVKVGVILPETATSARWEGFDKPILDKALRAAGLDPD